MKGFRLFNIYSLERDGLRQAELCPRNIMVDNINNTIIIQDKSGKCLTEEQEILSRWTKYCSELYNHETYGDNAVLDFNQPPEEDQQPILREEVEIAVAALKKGKSAGVDNIPAELV